MRELRFRAWVFYGERLKKPHYSRDYDSLDRFFQDHSANDIDQCIEQYTGLKDKNGKEIYEGDICAIDCPKCGLRGVAELVWNEERLCYRFKDIRQLCICDVRIFGKDCEVIGNVHENPELLKKEK